VDLMPRSIAFHRGTVPLSEEVTGQRQEGTEAATSFASRWRYTDRKSADSATDYQTFVTAANTGAYDLRVPGELIAIGDPSPVPYVVTESSIEQLTVAASLVLSGAGSTITSMEQGAVKYFGSTVGPTLEVESDIPSQWGGPSGPVDAWEYSAGVWKLNGWPSVRRVDVEFSISVPSANVRFQVVWEKKSSLGVWGEIKRTPEWQIDNTDSPRFDSRFLVGGTNFFFEGQETRLGLVRTSAGAAVNVTIGDVTIESVTRALS
jgi:hypothetical protein